MPHIVGYCAKLWYVSPLVFVLDSVFSPVGSWESENGSTSLRRQVLVCIGSAMSLYSIQRIMIERRIVTGILGYAVLRHLNHEERLHGIVSHPNGL